jgi:Fe-S cluster assembly iron-binding protein IscA
MRDEGGLSVITITPTAAARLSALIAEEQDADRLGIKIIATTSGCGSYAYSIAITEAGRLDKSVDVTGIRLFYRDEEKDLLDGIVVDFDPVTGRFSLTHTRPPQTNCPLSH